MSAAIDEEVSSLVPQNHLLETAKELTSGAAGGIVQVLIGQPFDLVKVRLQTQSCGSVVSTVRQIWTREGPLAFYKGTLVPLIGMGACVSVQFGTFHGFRQIVETYNQEYHVNCERSLSPSQIYLVGGIAGIANSLLSGPIEHIRIRLQTQSDGNKRLYAGPRDCMRHIIRQSGFFGLYRGQVANLIREFHGYGVWFATYEALMLQATRWSNQEPGELAGWKVALCGGLAGDALWLAGYPVDVVKTKMQSDGFGRDRVYRNNTEVIKQTWRQGGIRSFFSGLAPTLVRTMFTSAGTFLAAESNKRGGRSIDFALKAVSI